MPDNFIQWLWFVYYTIGSAGGWIALAGFLYVTCDEWKKIRRK